MYLWSVAQNTLFSEHTERWNKVWKCKTREWHMHNGRIVLMEWHMSLQWTLDLHKNFDGTNLVSKSLIGIYDWSTSIAIVIVIVVLIHVQEEYTAKGTILFSLPPSCILSPSYHVYTYVAYARLFPLHVQWDGTLRKKGIAVPTFASISTCRKEMLKESCSLRRAEFLTWERKTIFFWGETRSFVLGREADATHESCKWAKLRKDGGSGRETFPSCK